MQGARQEFCVVEVFDGPYGLPPMQEPQQWLLSKDFSSKYIMGRLDVVL
jgi:hypothetical protein